MSESGADGHAAAIAIAPDDRHNRELVANVHPPSWINPAPAARYDLVVLGAGTAGLVCAAGAAGLGARVALVERFLMGGDCLNFGCVPSKSLLAAAKAWHATKSGAAFGAPTADGGKGDFPRAMDRLRALRAEISKNDSAERFRRLGVDVFLGEARFATADCVNVEGTSLRFHRAVIATGARTAIPPIPGLGAVAYRTNETVFALESLPPRLAIIGAGPIGCELAQAFARFGSEVTLLDREAGILPRDDPDAAKVVADSMARDGVRFIGSASVSRVAESMEKKVLIVATEGREEEIAVEEILLATGRVPNLETLDLERAGIAAGAKGVKVDARLRTTNRRVYACGDAVGAQQFTHAADAMARAVIQNALFCGRARVNGRHVPWCTYTDPEIAHVGVDSTTARSSPALQTIDVVFADVDRARTDGEAQGFLRVHVSRRGGRLHGATIVGPRAGDLIGQVALAMNAGVTLGRVATTIYPYPTYGEALKKAADAWRRGKLTPAARRLLAALLKVGKRLP